MQRPEHLQRCSTYLIFAVDDALRAWGITDRSGCDGNRDGLTFRTPSCTGGTPPRPRLNTSFLSWYRGGVGHPGPVLGRTRATLRRSQMMQFRRAGRRDVTLPEKHGTLCLRIRLMQVGCSFIFFLWNVRPVTEARGALSRSLVNISLNVERLARQVSRRNEQFLNAPRIATFSKSFCFRESSLLDEPIGAKDVLNNEQHDSVCQQKNRANPTSPCACVTLGMSK